jgi:hypothetical protein
MEQGSYVGALMGVDICMCGIQTAHHGIFANARCVSFLSGMRLLQLQSADIRIRCLSSLKLLVRYMLGMQSGRLLALRCYKHPGSDRLW